VGNRRANLEALVPPLKTQTITPKFTVISSKEFLMQLRRQTVESMLSSLCHWVCGEWELIMICSKLVPNISIAELKASSERYFKSHMYIIFIEESNHNKLIT
jgi:hypothetical protein